MRSYLTGGRKAVNIFPENFSLYNIAYPNEPQKIQGLLMVGHSHAWLATLLPSSQFNIESNGMT